MIQIDIDMPKNCFECDKTYKWKKDGKVQCPHINMPSISSNTTNRPPYCPLKEVSDNSVLEDIKSEIQRFKDITSDSIEIHTIDYILSIFDKNISGKEQ